MNLKLDMIGQYHAGYEGHPQKIMRDLGITYKSCEPCSVSDCWYFFGCENLPYVLPSFLSKTNF